MKAELSITQHCTTVHAVISDTSYVIATNVNIALFGWVIISLV
jgi:hypothetical protein